MDTPETYSFNDVDGAAPAETLVTTVTEFSKANEFSQDQAQAFMDHTLASQPASLPESYVFSKVGEGAAAVDAPATLVTTVGEFAKANALTQEQAQSVLVRELANQSKAAPDAYTFSKVKDADGAEVDIAEPMTKLITEFATEAGLTQAQAQSFMDREIKLQDEANKEYAGQEARLQQEWQDATRKDPELSMDGKLDENLGIGKEALKKFFPTLAERAGEHAFLDHPEVIRGLVKIGRLLMEDGEVVSGRQSHRSQDRAASFYPTMVEK